MAAVTSCPEARVFQRLLGEKLSTVEIDILERHLTQCQKCVEKLEQMLAPQADDATGMIGAQSGTAARILQRLRGSPPDTASNNIESTAADLPATPVTPDPTHAVEPKKSAPVNMEATSDSLPQLNPASGTGNSSSDFQLGPSGASNDVEATSDSLPAVTVDKIVSGTKAIGPPAFDFLAPPQDERELGRLGSYIILKVLGKGGMGMVFKAEDPHLQRLVALKVMLPEIAKDEAAVQRFQREARATAQLKNDHVITIYQVGKDRNVPFIAMEFLEGDPLDQWLNQGNKPTVQQICRIGREIAAGLAAAHERNLIHRDIKPANIWLEGPNQRVKILDFGLARAVDEDLHLTKTGLIVGTPAYMAPEQAGGEPIDHRCDLFSLGCVLYRLCAGELPFTGTSTIALLKALALQEPKPLRDVNPSIPLPLSDIITRLLAKKPVLRFQTASAVVEALQQVEKQLTMFSGASSSGMRPLSSPGMPNFGSVSQPQAPREQSSAGMSRQNLQPAGSRSHHSSRHSHRRSSIGAGTVFLAVLLLSGAGGLGYYLYQRMQQSTGTVEVVCDFPKVRIQLSKGDQVEKLIDPDREKKISDLKVGDYKVKIIQGGEGLGVDPESFTLSFERPVVLTVKRLVDLPASALKPMDASWVKQTTALTGERAIQAVAQKMKERNPGFDGELITEVDDAGNVTELSFKTDNVLDIMPLQGFANMKQLILKGVGRLTDLSPLRGMKIEWLDVGKNKIDNLEALRDMPITTLFLQNNPVRDFSPLTTTRLKILEGVTLNSDKDAEVLRGIKTLERINGKKVKDYWQEYDSKKKKG